MSAKTKPSAPKDTVPTVEAGTLAKLFDLTPTRIAQLGKEGVLPKAQERGKYLLWPSVKNYIAVLRNPKLNAHGTADGTEQETLRTRREKKLDLECEKLRIQNQKLLGMLIPFEEMTEGAAMVGVKIKAAWEELEDVLPPQLEGLTALAMKSKLRDYGRMKCLELMENFEIIPHERHEEEEKTEADTDKQQMGKRPARKRPAKKRAKAQPVVG